MSGPDEDAFAILAKAQQQFEAYLRIAEVVQLVSENDEPPVSCVSSVDFTVNESIADDAVLV